MKKIVRLTESDLIKIVKRVINEQEEEIKNPVYLMGNYVTGEEYEGFEDDEDAMDVERGYLMAVVDHDELSNFLGKEPEEGDEYDILDDSNIYLFKYVSSVGKAYNDDDEIIEPEISDGFTQGTLTVVSREEFTRQLRRLR